MVHQRTYTHWRTRIADRTVCCSTHRVTKDDRYILVVDGLKLRPSLLSPKLRSFVFRQAKTKIKVHAQKRILPQVSQTKERLRVLVSVRARGCIRAMAKRTCAEDAPQRSGMCVLSRETQIWSRSLLTFSAVRLWAHDSCAGVA